MAKRSKRRVKREFASLQGESTVLVPCWGQTTRGRAAMNTENPAGGYLVLAGVQVAPGPILAMVIDRSNILADGAAPVRRIVMVRKLDADFSSFQIQLYMLYIPGGFDAQDLTVEFNVSHGSDDRGFDGRTHENPQGHI